MNEWNGSKCGLRFEQMQLKSTKNCLREEVVHFYIYIYICLFVQGDSWHVLLNFECR